MNIAILSDRLTQGGGTEIYLQYLINEFLQHGDSITVYTTKLSNDLSILKHNSLKIVKQDLSTCPKKLRHAMFGRFLRKQLKNHSFDLVLGVTTPYSPDIGICCGTYLGDMKVSPWQRKINPLNHIRIIYERKKYTQSRHLVAHSEVLKQELIDLYKIPPERISVLYPIPPLDQFHWKTKESKEKYRRKYKLSADRTYFLFPSTGHRRKGLQIIIDALKQLVNENVGVIVAGAPQDTFQKLNNLEYVGFVKDMSELYQACDVTLLPASYEPFGLVVIESLMCGTSVIISKHVGAKDLLDPSFGEVLESLNATCLAQAMKKYINSNSTMLDHSLFDRLIRPHIDHWAKLKELALM